MKSVLESTGHLAIQSVYIHCSQNESQTDLLVLDLSVQILHNGDSNVVGVPGIVDAVQIVP